MLGRLIAQFATLGIRWPKATLVALLGIVAVSATLALRIEVNTDRFDLIDGDNEYQARLNRFFERFGYPDSPLFVVSGGDARARRLAVDQLTAELASDSRFESRVMSKLDLNSVGPLMFVHEPQRLQALMGTDGVGGQIETKAARGLVGVTELFSERLLEGLDSGGDATQLNQGISQLLGFVRALKGTVEGKPEAQILSGLSSPSGEGGRGQTTLATSNRRGVDSEGYLEVRSHELHLVAVFPDLSSGKVEDSAEVVESLRAARERALLKNGTTAVEIELTGLPVLTYDEHLLVQEGLVDSSVATSLALMALLVLAFRSLRTSIDALIPLGIGVVIAAAAVQLIYGELNPITASLFALLLGLGIDFSIHLLARFHEERRAGLAHVDALRRAYELAGPGMLMGALTTSAVFLTIVGAKFTAFSELGVNSAVGVMIIFVVTVIVLPLIMTGPLAPKKVAPAPRVPGLARMPGLIRRFRWWVLGVGLLTGIAGIASATALRFNMRYVDFLPQSVESSSALRTLEKTREASPFFAYVSADGVEATRSVSASLRALGTVATVQTATDLLPELSDERLVTLRLATKGLRGKFTPAAEFEFSSSALMGALAGLSDSVDEVEFAAEQGGIGCTGCTELKAEASSLRQLLGGNDEGAATRLAEADGKLRVVLLKALETAKSVADRGGYVPNDLPAVFRHRYVSKDGKSLAVFVFPKESIWISESARRFASEVESVDPNAAGHAMTVHIHQSMILDDFWNAALIAAFCVVGIMLLDFRSLRDALFAVVPLILGWGWLFGVLVIFDIPLNIASILGLPLILGIGADAGIHLVHRYRQSIRERGEATLEDVVAGTGSAVLIASLTTIAGFGGLLFPDHGGMTSLGQLMMIGVGGTLVASVVVLPALMVVVGRAR